MLGLILGPGHQDGAESSCRSQRRCNVVASCWQMPAIPTAPSVQEMKNRATDMAAQAKAATAAVSSTASAKAGCATAATVAAVSATAVAGAAVGAVAAVTAPPEPPPPPRECWTFSLFGSCAEQPEFASYACVVPCIATAEISTYRKTGNPDAKTDACALFCNLAACAICDDGLMSSERERVRDKTNMVPGDCCKCNAACWDTCLTTAFCWGCAAAQMKRELQVWFGHAGEGAPVHPGSPAAKRS